MTPINRKRPKASQFRRATNLLKAGKRLALFAEGTRSRDLKRAKSGFVSLVKASQVPVVPVSISGTYGLLRKETWLLEISKAVLRLRPPITVVIHKPIYLESGSGESSQSIADRVMAVIATGLPPNERGFYGDIAPKGCGEEF